MYLPPSFDVPDWSFRELISEGAQFAKITQNWGDLFTKLQHRFDDLSLHKLCYFHSYHPMEDVIRQINSIVLDNDQKSAFVMQTDASGMTPLHILALAQTPRLELLQELVTSVDIPLTAKDRFGSTPLHGLSWNACLRGRFAGDSSMVDEESCGRTRCIPRTRSMEARTIGPTGGRSRTRLIVCRL